MDHADTADRAQAEDAQAGQGYRTLGIVVLVALAAVVILAAMGAAPGMLSPDQAFTLLGGTAVVLSVAMVAVLFALSKSFQMLREHSDAIDAQQDAIRETRQEAQVARDADQDRATEKQIARLEERLEAIEDTGAGAAADAMADDEADARIGERVAQLEQRLTDLEATASGIEADAAAREEADAQAEADAQTPFGDIHEVEDIEGIGDTYGDKLRRIGIVDTEELWQADPEKVAEQLDASPRNVRHWQQQAELVALTDVGPQYAELLNRAGIASISELASSEAGEVLEAIEAKQDELEVNIQGANVNESRVQGWIQRARDHAPAESRVRRSGPSGD